MEVYVKKFLDLRIFFFPGFQSRFTFWATLYTVMLYMNALLYCTVNISQSQYLVPGLYCSWWKKNMKCLGKDIVLSGNVWLLIIICMDQFLDDLFTEYIHLV